MCLVSQSELRDINQYQAESKHLMFVGSITTDVTGRHVGRHASVSNKNYLLLSFIYNLCVSNNDVLEYGRVDIELFGRLQYCANF